jgi:amidohydrolase
MVSIADFDPLLSELIAWRHDFHAHPELTFDVHRTAALVAERLSAMGVDEVVTGIGKTGVVGVIRGAATASGRVIGLRADMDALPMQEQTNLPYASKTEGRMHACGHDGHTTMLLGTARYLCDHREFDGTVVLIFQPAEEAESGGLAMVQDGLMDRFGIQKVFGVHNIPKIPVGHFAIRTGGIMASADLFKVMITGKGYHASSPEKGIDPTIAIAQIINAFQTIVSRSVTSADRLVVTITQIHMGTADNVIAETAGIRGTVRSLSPNALAVTETRMTEICAGVGAMTGATVSLTYTKDLPVTYNDPSETKTALDAAASLVGAQAIDADTPPIMGGEDFSFMLAERPGAFMFIGNGDSAPAHNQAYDFNDDPIPYGCAYFAALVENQLARDV